MTRCPTCKKFVDVTKENRFRPFCSERCQLVGLGTWAEEGFRIPGHKLDDDTVHPDDRKKPRILH